MSTATPNSDAILAAIFDPQLTAADLPAKTGMSLPQLARWLKANAHTVAEVKEFLTQRASLIATRLHTSSLGALDRVVRECPDLERVRKAASTILRSLKVPTNPTRERGAPCAPESAHSVNTSATFPVEERSDHLASHSARVKATPLSDRFAAMRLAKLAQSPAKTLHDHQLNDADSVAHAALRGYPLGVTTEIA